MNLSLKDMEPTIYEAISNKSTVFHRVQKKAKLKSHEKSGICGKCTHNLCKEP